MEKGDRRREREGGGEKKMGWWGESGVFFWFLFFFFKNKKIKNCNPIFGHPIFKIYLTLISFHFLFFHMTISLHLVWPSTRENTFYQEFYSYSIYEYEISD